MISKKIVNTTKALDYIRKQFSRGRSLSILMHNLDFSSGQVFALVPDNLSEDKIYNFQEGLYPFDTNLLKTKYPAIQVQNYSRKFLLETIHDYLEVAKEHCCLFEDPISIPTDSRVLNSGLNCVSLSNDQVFYFFNSENNDVEKIEDAIKISDDYIFLCVLSSLDVGMQSGFNSTQSVSLDILKAFTDNLYAFFIGAYDGESYILWVKN